MNEDIILQTLKEIRDDQKIIMEKVTRLERDWEISINGYRPHEVVEFFHFINKLKQREERKIENIRKAIINWITPILLSGVVLGILQYIR